MSEVPITRIFAWRLCSTHQKDLICTICGERGAGKSLSGLYICHRTAQEVAKIRGGVWSDYFTLDNVSVINSDDLIQKMTNLRKFNIYLLDDVGTSWGSRNFMSRINQKLGSILQIARTQRCMIMISIPDLYLLDKQPRTMVSFHIEVAESLHDQGVNLLKIFRTSRLIREGKSLYSHLVFHSRGGRAKAVRWIARLPPKDMVEEYERIRRQRALDFMKAGLEVKESDEEGEGKVAQKLRRVIENYGEEVRRLHTEGKNLKDISRLTGLSEYTVKKMGIIE